MGDVPRTFFRDFNGDGLSDILSLKGINDQTDFYDDWCWLALSNGDGSFSIDDTITAEMPLFDVSNGHFTLGDFDGEGTTDLLYLTMSPHLNNNWQLLNAHTASRLVQITRELPNGAPQTRIEYQPASNREVYKMGSGAIYPIRDITPDLHLVSRIEKTVYVDEAGEHHDYTTDYTYGVAREHLKGRGFLGFQQFESYDHQTRLSYIKTLAHTFPLTGETLKSETFYDPESGDSQLIKLVENHWLYDLVSGGTLLRIPHRPKRPSGSWVSPIHPSPR